MRLLESAGFVGSDLDAAMAAVNDHVVGAVIAEVAWRDTLARMSGTGSGWDERAAEYLRQLAERHPTLAGRMAATGEIDVERESERRFTFGLGCLLDGLATRCATPSSS